MGLVMINGAVMRPKAAVSSALRAYGKGGRAKRETPSHWMVLYYWCPLKNQALFTNDCFVGQPTFGMCRQTISGLKPRKMDEKYKKWHAFIASMSNTTHIF